MTSKTLAPITKQLALFHVVLVIVLLTFSPASSIEKLGNEELSHISGQSGVTVILEDFKVTTEMGRLSIGGEDGLGIPAAADGAYFVFDSNRVTELDVERGSFDFDVFTLPTNYVVDGEVMIPAGTTASCIDFGEACFNINMSDAIVTLKFANNPDGNANGMTDFSKTVCNFALNGSTVTVKSDDVKMYIFSH